MNRSLFILAEKYLGKDPTDPREATESQKAELPDLSFTFLDLN
jgi:hypothetical protein